MRTLEQATAAKRLLTPVRDEWRVHIDASFPTTPAGRLRPQGYSPWPWFDGREVGQGGETRAHRSHRAKRVGAGLSALAAGACTPNLAWGVLGQDTSDLTYIRGLLWCLVQCAAGYEQVAAGLYGRGNEGFMKLAQLLPQDVSVWPPMPPALRRNLATFSKDLQALPEPKGCKKESDYLIALLRDGQCPLGAVDRIRAARGLRHLVAHGVLSPKKARDLSLVPWLNAAIDDFVATSVSAAVAALPNAKDKSPKD